MKRVTGIGGIFIKSADTDAPARLVPEASRRRRRRTGVAPRSDWAGPRNPGWHGTTVWSLFDASSNYFEPSNAPFMVNYRVEEPASVAGGTAQGRLPGRRRASRNPSSASSAGCSIPTATRSSCGSRPRDDEWRVRGSELVADRFAQPVLRGPSTPAFRDTPVAADEVAQRIDLAGAVIGRRPSRACPARRRNDSCAGTPRARRVPRAIDR